MSRRDRRARADLDAQLGDNRQAVHHHAAEIQQLLATRKTAELTDRQWLVAHSPESERFLAVNEELRARDLAVSCAARHVEGLHRDPLDHTLQLPDRGLDLGR